MRQSREKKSFFEAEYSKVISNMVGPSTTPSKSKGKQLVLSSEESDTKHSSGLKEILIEPEGITEALGSKPEQLPQSTIIAGLRD